MKAKKTEVITFRTDEKTRCQLERIAELKDWTIAQTVHNLCKKYIEENKIKEV